MPAKLTFKVADLLPLIQHTEKATEHRGTYGAKPVPALWLVKDQGIYLMSSAKESLPGEIAKNKVVYAKGYAPTGDEWWEKCHDAVGGDDFVEALPIVAFQDAVKHGDTTITITISKTSLTMRSK